jgi:aconitate hydratase
MVLDPYNTKKTLKTPKGKLNYWSLQELKNHGFEIEKLPFSIRILLENVLRNFDDFAITKENIDTLLGWKPQPSDKDIPFKPARVLMQDFTGVPAVVDLASLRAEAARKGKDPNKINPLIPVDLIIDHSVQVDFYGNSSALKNNVSLEYERNSERYQFLKWAQKAFNNFSVVPPGMGICHQVNLEYLAQGIIARDGNVFPDTLVGTDSHTPMVNGIGVLAWGVGGIEAEAALLGQPVYFIMPEVVGLKLLGKLPLGTTATDLVLNITSLLRQHGVVGKFVEVFGSGLDFLSVTDRATISNMSPEFGCTITYFPIDNQTLDYMRKSNRSEDQVQMVETYTKANMLWRENENAINYSSIVELDISTIEPTVSGPKRPQDKILLKEFKNKFSSLISETYKRNYIPIEQRANGQSKNFDENLRTVLVDMDSEKFALHDGSVVIAAITSCTNTSNPNVMIGAGLLAKKAREKGLQVKSWVKTSLAPGSKVVTDYLVNSGLMNDLEALRFFNTGYGCSSCIGNSGPLPDQIAKAVVENELVVASVLSGNRNFEARVHPQVKMNFLMSPILVVAYALAGRVDIDLVHEPLAYDSNQVPVFLKDIWPSNDEISEIMLKVLSPADFKRNYSTIFEGDDQWKNLEAPDGQLYNWDKNSSYIKEAPFFNEISPIIDKLKDIKDANVLLKLGDSITTDHISPAGSFNENSPAGKYLLARNIEKSQFNSYGSRRGNDEVMVRGTFANVRIKNQLIEKEGGFTKHIPSGLEMSVFEASEKYKAENIPLIVLAGKEYGSGSSRDWAAKGPNLLGIKAVIAESYERIHRSNLVGMGILPLQFLQGQNAGSLGLTGTEIYQITGIADNLKSLKTMNVQVKRKDGSMFDFEALCRLDSAIEVEYYHNGGILHYVLRHFLKD